MSSVLNVKIDPKVKIKAHKIAAELGLSLSGVVNVYLRELIRTRTICATTREENPSARLLASIKSTREDRKKGRLHSFDNAKDAITYLHKLSGKKR